MILEKKYLLLDEDDLDEIEQEVGREDDPKKRNLPPEYTPTEEDEDDEDDADDEDDKDDEEDEDEDDEDSKDAEAWDTEDEDEE